MNAKVQFTVQVNISPLAYSGFTPQERYDLVVQCAKNKAADLTNLGLVDATQVLECDQGDVLEIQKLIDDQI